MKKIGILFAVILLFSLALPVKAALLKTDKSGELMNNVNNLANQTDYETAITIDSTIASIIKIAMSFLGSIFIILMIIAGLDWMRAEGNEEIVKKSKSTIINLVIGLIIIIAAFILSSFIGNIFADLITK